MTDTAELKERLAQVTADLEAQKKDKAVKEAEECIARLVGRRDALSCTSAVMGGAGIVMTIGRIGAYWNADTSIIVWLIALMLLGATCVAITQVAIVKRVILTAINSNADSAKDELRQEFRASRPAEQADLTQLASLMDAMAAQARQLATMVTMSGIQLHERFNEMAVEIKNLRERQIEIERAIPAAVVAAMKARDEAYVDALSAAEAPSSNGHKGPWLVRSAIPDDRR